MTYEVTGDYTTFAKHPMAETYFKYVEILKSKNMDKYAKHLTDIANAPINTKIRNEISDVMSALLDVVRKNTDPTNEFLELAKQTDGAH